MLRLRAIAVENDVCSLQFSVTDNGIGIPEKVQPMIFQPFFQADNSTSRQFGGSGNYLLGFF
jgi:signal transduction histidine kinase